MRRDYYPAADGAADASAANAALARFSRLRIDGLASDAVHEGHAQGAAQQPE